jgi:small subunit ribosomal protein S24e
MNLAVQSKKENSLLKRTEVEFEVTFDAAIPSREQTRQALAAALQTNKENLVVVSIDSSSGVHKAKGIARLYTSADMAKKDKKYLLIRDKMVEKEAKKKK